MKLSTWMLIGTAYLWVTFGFTLEILRVQKVEAACGVKEDYRTPLIIGWPIVYPAGALAHIASKYVVNVPVPTLCDRLK